MTTYTSVSIRTPQRIAEVAWFDDLCGGDTAFLGELDPSRRSNYEHCSSIAEEADRHGFRNILLPTSYMVGQEGIPFAAAVAHRIEQMNLLLAIRTGEIHPPMLARHIATLDHLLKGRLTINIINSDLPGCKEDPDLRYQRCAEVIEILQQAWTRDEIDHQGKVYPSFHLKTDPLKPYQQNGGPLLYFGGTSPGSRDLCARYCDVFLMWPETEEQIYATMQDMSQRAAVQGRQIDFGLRIHIIVRETEAAAREHAALIMSRFDADKLNLKNRAQDAQSEGVRRQDALRTEKADADDFVEPHLWMGIGRARSGCGGALVGTPEQILSKLQRYMDMGIRSFILSGYPLKEEADYVAKYILPHLPLAQLNVLQGRKPTTEPITPLTSAPLQ
ncbi:MAG: LLM class flavin-dependent oxidoreductase [Chitinophagaceae bacterium]|nr:LLM class flavin-dependent oxidoreductase [Chitinophagaceae bacterium]